MLEENSSDRICKKGDVIMGSRKLNVPNKSLHYLYSSIHIILGTRANEVRWASHADCMGEIIEARWIVVEKNEVTAQLGRRRCRW
jgi:hypothetical protein